MTEDHAGRLAEALEAARESVEYDLKFIKHYGPSETALAVEKRLADIDAALAAWRAHGGCADGFDLVQFIGEQIEFSERTFGPGTRTSGVIAHIRKELAEIEESPHDLTEWVDVMLLAFDGAWRAGYRPDEIAAALRAKFEKNKRRSWPDWRQNTDGPIEHIPEPSDV